MELAMQVKIYSKSAMLARLKTGPLGSTAVISFYNSPVTAFSKPIDYTGQADRFLQIDLPDLDEHGLAEYGFTAETFFSQAEEVAAFIHNAHKDGLGFACQCQFGSSRSAACAAAILAFFEHRGDEICKNERYMPNLLIYRKLLSALEKYGAAEALV